MKKNTLVEIALLILLAVIFLPLEILCAYLAYETLGEITSLMYFMALGLNLPFILLAFRNRILAAFGMTLLALTIIPYQLFLGNRLIRVQAEASRIVTYVYKEKIASGYYPDTLADYTFHDDTVVNYIQSYNADNNSNGFSLFYRVGTESTSHSYISDLGWGYYPD